MLFLQRVDYTIIRFRRMSSV